MSSDLGTDADGDKSDSDERRSKRAANVRIKEIISNLGTETGGKSKLAPMLPPPPALPVGLKRSLNGQHHITSKTRKVGGLAGTVVVPSPSAMSYSGAAGLASAAVVPSQSAMSYSQATGLTRNLVVHLLSYRAGSVKFK